MNLETAIGTIGSLTILLAFVLNQTHKLKDTDFKYDLLNFAGSILLLYYAAAIESYPFIIINTVWGIVSLKDLIGKANKN